MIQRILLNTFGLYFLLVLAQFRLMEVMLADLLPLILVKMVMAVTLQIFSCVFISLLVMRMVRHFEPVFSGFLLVGELSGCVRLHCSFKLVQSDALVVDDEGSERIPVRGELVLGVFTYLLLCRGYFLNR